MRAGAFVATGAALPLARSVKPGGQPARDRPRRCRRLRHHARAGPARQGPARQLRPMRHRHPKPGRRHVQAHGAVRSDRHHRGPAARTGRVLGCQRHLEAWQVRAGKAPRLARRLAVLSPGRRGQRGGSFVCPEPAARPARRKRRRTASATTARRHPRWAADATHPAAAACTPGPGRRRAITRTTAPAGLTSIVVDAGAAAWVRTGAALVRVGTKAVPARPRARDCPALQATSQPGICK